MAKILFVDDDYELLSIVSEFLGKEGHRTELCHTKQEATDALALSAFDLIVLDVQLPDGTGFDICRDYRTQGGVTPILMLTGQAQERDKELGLDLGADDYLTKPFSLRELAARVRALLRRPAVYNAQVLEVRDLRLDLSARKLFKGQREIRLQPLDFALLEFFMKHPNQSLSQETILRRVWEAYSESGIEALRASVKRIRKEIDNEDQPSLIETVHKVGYAFRPGSQG